MHRFKRVSTFHRLEPAPHPFASIPFRRDPTFVDRGNVLNQVDLQCSEPASRVALVGFGGVGKSQLAIEFAHRLAARSTERWLFWVHASTQARVIEGFKTIADNVKLWGRNQPEVDVLQLVFDWLSNERNGKWLLVLDSADDYDVLYGVSGNVKDGRPLATYLPQSHNGCIILTTRNKDLAFRLTGDYQRIHEIGPMTQQEALKLLENRLGLLSDADVAAELVTSLDLIPLAISQAAAYIQMRAPRTSLVQYLREFRKSESKRVELLSYDAGDLRRDLRQDGGASNAILTTWQVSFDHIRSRRPSAADLLSLMSFFDRQGIPESLLKPSKESHDSAQTTGLDDTTDSEIDGSDDETGSDFEGDVATLRDYCLIILSEAENTFEMHGLVQLSTRRWLKAHGLQERFQEQYITVMADAFPIGNYENWTVMETSRTKLGADHPNTLTSMANLAWTYWKQGRWEEAEKLQVQVLEVSRTKLGADHPDTL
ncbi:NB-ARC domain-containing protein [Fusarium keratoplasticum]|nr:NB-ARC domain-containing protein [Fusarium keratoplasticum]